MVERPRPIPQLGTLGGLHQIAHELRETYAAGEKLLYSTSEIPVFYLFSEPDLVRLKRHVWTHRGRGNPYSDLPVLHLPPASSGTVSTDFTHTELLALRGDYERIRRTELWSEGMFDNVIGQLLYESALRQTPLTTANEPLVGHLPAPLSLGVRRSFCS